MDRAVFLRFFFFQAKDGIRDVAVTGVQTCALPIFGVTYHVSGTLVVEASPDGRTWAALGRLARVETRAFPLPPALLRRPSVSIRLSEIGRASCRERV